jgi:hypothetical protein
MARSPSLPVRLAHRIRGALASVRLRLVWWFVVVLAVATVISVVAVRLILVGRVDARIEAELRQEVSEVELLATGNDPLTGEPFGEDVARIFEVALERNVPARYEVLVTFVDGETAGQSGGEAAPLLEDLPVDAWAAIEAPGRGRLATPDGRTIEYVALPLLVRGDVANAGIAGQARIHRAMHGAPLFAAYHRWCSTGPAPPRRGPDSPLTADPSRAVIAAAPGGVDGPAEARNWPC